MANLLIFWNYSLADSWALGFTLVAFYYLVNTEQNKKKRLFFYQKKKRLFKRTDVKRIQLIYIMCHIEKYISMHLWLKLEYR